MIPLRLITRIAIFSAIVYVLSWGTSYLPNFNLAFFIIFSTGFIWGLLPGVLVGIIGMGLWTAFNPFGPAMPPVMIAQVLGAAGSGVVGFLFFKLNWKKNNFLLKLKLSVAAMVCTLFYYLLVSVVDAWLFQPFWPRLISGLPWIGISFVSNILIFPLLFNVTLNLYNRECIKLSKI